MCWIFAEFFFNSLHSENCYKNHSLLQIVAKEGIWSMCNLFTISHLFYIVSYMKYINPYTIYVVQIYVGKFKIDLHLYVFILYFEMAVRFYSVKTGLYSFHISISFWFAYFEAWVSDVASSELLYGKFFARQQKPV